jgi:uncharacterized protein YndB with AHSA1/START domain
MGIEFTISTEIPAAPEQVYHAWLDSELHSTMTGGTAHVNAEIGVDFDAWDGYIHGRNLELTPGKRILQAWRTAEFTASEADSLLEITLEPEGKSTRLTLRQTNLPEHGMKYKQGWFEAYFEPMQAFFMEQR